MNAEPRERRRKEGDEWERVKCVRERSREGERKGEGASEWTGGSRRQEEREGGRERFERARRRASVVHSKRSDTRHEGGYLKVWLVCHSRSRQD